LPNFPEKLEPRPDLLLRVVKIADLTLIPQIQSMIQYFGNIGVCMLHVAKTLLCRPEQSMPTVFGSVAVELNLIHLSFSA
jgi:hypothetical protein